MSKGKAVRIVIWSLTGIVAGGLLFFLWYWHAFLGADYYTYLTTYPAACWSDDGKQIIYLEHREIERYGGLRFFGDAGRKIASKTYLMIMDANGKNKKVVGEVVHPKDRENFDNAMKKYEEGKIFLTNFGNMKSSDNKYALRLSGKSIEVTEADNWRNIIWKMYFKESKSYLFMPFWWRV